MNREPLKETVLRILGAIAPDVDLETVAPDVQFRDQFDFDSMDFLNFAIGLHKELKIDIPEIDYPRIGTLNGCLAYLEQALASRSP